jgi:steroid 5-alpha reductase family enzyme
MKRDPSAFVTPVATLVAAGMAWAGSRGGATVGSVPVFALAVALVFLGQWAAFLPAYRFQTERYYDLTGSATYIVVTSLAAILGGPLDVRSALLLALVLLWALRLGTFLFRRIRRAGRDGRFDAIKPSVVRFLNAWTLQALWITLTASAALAALASRQRVGLDAFAVIGTCVWIAGFAIEAIADRQKSRFRAEAANKGGFIHTGLWAWSRHPNYFGEIVLWTGIAIIAYPALQGWQLATLVSPLFVYLLLTRVSGIPLLEKKAEETWGGQPDWEGYRSSTPALVPRPPRRPGS